MDKNESWPRNLIDSLPQHLSEALRLRVEEKLPYVDIAKRLNISTAGSRKRVQLAREQLRQRVNEGQESDRKA